MALEKQRTFQRQHYRQPIRYLCVMQRPAERVTDPEHLRHSGNRVIKSLQPSLKFRRCQSLYIKSRMHSDDNNRPQKH